MTITELEQAIRDCVCELYEKEYIGPLKLIPLKPFGWDLRLGFDNDYKPLHIAAQLDDCAFLKYIYEELRTRHLNDIHFYTGYQIMHPTTYDDGTQQERPRFNGKDRQSYR